MTLDRLLELAYMCEYVELNEFGDIKEFTKRWHTLLNVELEDLQLSRKENDDT